MAEKRPKHIKTDIMQRVTRLYIAAIALVIIIAVRIVFVLFFSSEIRTNSARLEKHIFRTATLHAHRGAIRARTGESLASSIFRYTIEFDFGAEGFDDEKRFRSELDSLAPLLAAFFGDKSAAEYRQRFIEQRNKNNKSIVKGHRTVYTSHGWRRWLDSLRGNKFKKEEPIVETSRNHRGVKMFRDVDFNEWQILKTYPLLNSSALIYSRHEHAERAFPLGDLARRTVGRNDDRGRYGLEYVFDEDLRGVDGIEWRQHIAYGFWGRINKPKHLRDSARRNIENRDPVDGADVITTIDVDIQEFAERTLRERIAAQNAYWGTTMVMDVETGDLLAIVNLTATPDGIVENANYAFGRRAEPGSTFKVASMLALLDDAHMPVTQTYDAKHGKTVYIDTGGKHPVTVTDSGDDGGVIDMRTALVNSSNTWFAQAVYDAYRDNPDRYTDFLRRLHLDRKVCVGLPESMGERQPDFQCRTSGHWTPHVSLIKMAFGQGGMELTPLQVLTLYNAIANNGRMVAPRLVTEVRRGGKTVRKYPVEVLEEKICSRATLDIVREALEETALNGTGKEWFGEGKLPFRAALKTGTAENAQGGAQYSDGYRLASMATYFPAEKPRYTIMTSIFTKKWRGTAWYGGPLSGPVNRDIALFIYNRDKEWQSRIPKTGEEHHPVAVKGGSIEQVRKVARELTEGMAGGSARTGWGRTSVDSTSHVRVEPVAEGSSMPDVRGMGLKDAVFILEERGLKVNVTGKGTVRSQSIAPGQTIKRGMSVNIVLRTK